MKELDKILKACKNNRAPGLDSTPAETYKWMDEDSKLHILDLFNSILSTQKLPTEWSEALVVEIFKTKGNAQTQRTTDHSAYSTRPTNSLPGSSKHV